MTQENLLNQYLDTINYNLNLDTQLLLCIKVLEHITNYLFNDGQIKESQIINEFIEKMKGWI